jgi:hypothetical protein
VDGPKMDYADSIVASLASLDNVNDEFYCYRVAVRYDQPTPVTITAPDQASCDFNAAYPLWFSRADVDARP